MSRRCAPRQPRCSTPHLTPLQKRPGRPVRSVGPEIGVDMRLEALDFPARSLAEGLLLPSVTVPSTSKKPTQHGKLKRQVHGIVPRTVSVSQWDRPPRISNHANHLGRRLKRRRRQAAPARLLREETREANGRGSSSGSPTRSSPRQHLGATPVLPTWIRYPSSARLSGSPASSPRSRRP